jgi:glutathione S-transferase
LDQNSEFIPGLLDEFPNLKEFHARIGGLEKVAAYLSSDKCIKYPLNGPMAQWGGKLPNDHFFGNFLKKIDL